MNDDRLAAIRDRLAQGVEAFNSGDLDAAAAGYAPDCRYQIARDHPETRLCVGRDEIRSYQQQWFEEFDEIEFAVSEVEIRWPIALVTGEMRGRGTGSGVPLTVELALIYELNDELEAVAVEEFIDLPRARREFDRRAAASANH